MGHPCIVFLELLENWEIPLTCLTCFILPFISSFQGSIFCSCLHTRVRYTRKVNLMITEHKKTSLRCKSWISVVCTLRAIKTIWGKLSLLQVEGFSKKWNVSWLMLNSTWVNLSSSLKVFFSSSLVPDKGSASVKRSAKFEFYFI